MNLNKLSVIIPHYNSPEKLSRLLSTIPHESWIEVIVIDDHSIIDMAGHFRDLNNRYPGWIFLSQDKGVKGAGAARNKGISVSSGEWMIFADSDDFFTDDGFFIIKEYVLSSKKVDVVFFAPTSRAENGGSSLRHELYQNIVCEYDKTHKRELLYRFYVPWSKLYSRQFLVENNIFFENVVASNDVMFSLKASFFADRVAVDRRSVYCVVESGSSLTKTINEATLDSRVNVLFRYNDFLKINGKGDCMRPVAGYIWSARKLGCKKMVEYFLMAVKGRYPIFKGVGHLRRAFKKLISA